MAVHTLADTGPVVGQKRKSPRVADLFPNPMLKIAVMKMKIGLQINWTKDYQEKQQTTKIEIGRPCTWSW